MHRVAVLVPSTVVVLELAIACHVFGSAVDSEGRRPYEVLVCGSGSAAASTFGGDHFTVSTPRTWRDAGRADTLIVPGSSGFLGDPDPELLAVLKQAGRRRQRVLGVCVGAFALGAAGLLDGMRATTHWKFAGELARRYPAAKLEPAALFVEDGDILTSAGVTAALDLTSANSKLTRRFSETRARAQRSASSGSCPLPACGSPRRASRSVTAAAGMPTAASGDAADARSPSASRCAAARSAGRSRSGPPVFVSPATPKAGWG